MDRRLFLIPKDTGSVTPPGQCQLDECICTEDVLPEATTGKKKTLIHLSFITILAFITASFFNLLQKEQTIAAILSDREINSLACGPVNTSDANDIDHSKPFDQNKSNCPHQLIAGMACCFETKRKTWIDDDAIS